MRFCFVALVLFTCSLAHAQVFEVSATASAGAIDQGSGQALYGGFGLNASDGAAYNVYRKFSQIEDGAELPEVENDPGNPSSMTWTGLHQVGGAPGVISPGMFIGTTPSTSTYEDQLLYLKPLIDDGGGGNGDENLRRRWGTRVGFLEDPSAYIATAQPNSEDMDLWTGNLGTDAAYMIIHPGSNNTLSSDDWFIRTNTPARLNAAESEYDDERGRARPDIERTYIATGDELEAEGNQGFAGVGYDEPFELSWKMELNSPGNADPVRAREVLLSVKAGNVFNTMVFDPGSPDEAIAPNDEVDGVEYSDGFFDWQNATPVFFLGAIGGTVDGLGSMGIFIPGDFNADGTVDAADEAILNENIGEFDTTYSKGDLDQDGDTDADDLTAWLSLQDPAAAIDAITDITERIAYVHDVVGTWMGDANLDNEFNSGDLVSVFQEGLFETGQPATWATGDWSGDGVFDSGDFVVAFQDGGFELGPRAAVQAVPEPATGVMVFACLIALLPLRRR